MLPDSHLKSIRTPDSTSSTYSMWQFSPILKASSKLNFQQYLKISICYATWGTMAELAGWSLCKQTNSFYAYWLDLTCPGVGYESWCYQGALEAPLIPPSKTEI